MDQRELDRLEFKQWLKNERRELSQQVWVCWLGVLVLSIIASGWYIWKGLTPGHFFFGLGIIQGTALAMLYTWRLRKLRRR